MSPKCPRTNRHSSGVVLPNSELENKEIERRFRVVRPSVVVPNAADSGAFSPALDPWPGGREPGSDEPSDESGHVVEAAHPRDGVARIRADSGPETAHPRSLSLKARDFGLLVPRFADVEW